MGEPQAALIFASEWTRIHSSWVDRARPLNFPPRSMGLWDHYGRISRNLKRCQEANCCQLHYREGTRCYQTSVVSQGGGSRAPIPLLYIPQSLSLSPSLSRSFPLSLFISLRIKRREREGRSLPSFFHYDGIGWTKEGRRRRRSQRTGSRVPFKDFLIPPAVTQKNDLSFND